MFEIVNGENKVVDTARSHTEALSVVTFHTRKAPSQGPFFCRPVA